MLLPLVSVSLIGLLVGVVVRPLTTAGRPLAPRVVVALVGAWAGFAVLGLTGVTVDVIAGTGVWVAALGHAGAALGAVLAARGDGVPGRRRGRA
ncbi:MULTISPECIES: hypothetical protein [Mumia]|uniref:hypothetical protein n=1 Tax=Mumia TaxID=1546255 RepID=UPI00141F4884|nr:MULTISPECIES: hypothetical protein [unclassified Mumia]QMW67419.1 hypothetical protein H4N58_05820 [Mumia sp. ZJ1417]